MKFLAAAQAHTQADKFLIRLPDGMREAIQRAATENRRTMTGEIIARLEQSFANEGQKPTTKDHAPKALVERVEAIERTLQRLAIPDFATGDRLDDVESRLKKLEAKGRK